MGTGRAANATGARASAHRTRLQLALVGRADERAARHHLRRILPLIEISAKRITTGPKKALGPTRPRPATQARALACRGWHRPHRAIRRVLPARVVPSETERPARTSDRPRARPEHMLGRATCRLVRDTVSVEWFELMQVACRGPGRANAPTTRMRTQHHSRTLDSVHRGRPRLACCCCSATVP